jgi:hypothetical protein
MNREAAPTLEQATQSPERFVGTPTEVPFQGIEFTIPDAEKDMWKPGIIDFNNGLVAAHDKERPVVHIAPQGDSGRFQGYESGSATVPLSGGDQRGWPGGQFSRDIVIMGVNEVARNKGVMGRTVPTEDGKYEYFTANPFDDGDFLDMTGVSETTPDGKELRHTDIVSELASVNSEKNRSVDSVGSYNVNNGILAWVTPEGRVQIAPVSEDRLARLSELGYSTGDIDVPHSNRESFTERQYGNPAQTFGEIILADMKAAGETMTMDERNTRFANVIIPTEYLGVIRH